MCALQVKQVLLVAYDSLGRKVGKEGAKMGRPSKGLKFASPTAQVFVGRRVVG
jgi:hypothetical protein